MLTLTLRVELETEGVIVYGAYKSLYLDGRGSSPVTGGSSGIPAIDLADLGSLKNIKDQLNGHD
jgi:hypothetical protein